MRLNQCLCDVISCGRGLNELWTCLNLSSMTPLGGDLIRSRANHSRDLHSLNLGVIRLQPNMITSCIYSGFTEKQEKFWFPHMTRSEPNRTASVFVLPESVGFCGPGGAGLLPDGGDERAAGPAAGRGGPGLPSAPTVSPVHTNHPVLTRLLGSVTLFCSVPARQPTRRKVRTRTATWCWPRCCRCSSTASSTTSCAARRGSSTETAKVEQVLVLDRLHRLWFWTGCWICIFRTCLVHQPLRHQVQNQFMF